MKINNTSSTGVFVYTDDAKFEENDFVVYGTAIYVCKPKEGITEVSGELPPESDNYIMYLGDQSTDISEYQEFLETGEGENKYLSTLTLQQVLNSFILGPDGKGIIGDSIVYSKEIDETTGKPVYDCHLSGGTLYTDPESVLADIMNDRNINHAILRVSRLLPEIVVYVGKPLETEDTTTDLLGCILRQYTYKSEDTGHTIRIQELIDQVDGLIYYRSADIDVDTVSSATNFKCATTNTESLKKKADNIFALYNSRLKILRSLEKHLKENFRYRRVDIQGKKTEVSIPGIGDNLPEVTVMITEYDQEKMIRYNSEASFSLKDVGSDGVYPEYGVGKNHKIKILVSSDGDVNLYLRTNSGGIPGTSKVWISGVYYREYYDL